MNSAGNDIKRTDQSDEADIFMTGVRQTVRVPQNKNIITKCDCSETQRYLGIMSQPPFGRQHRPGRNGSEQQRKWKKHPWIRRNHYQACLARLNRVNGNEIQFDVIFCDLSSSVLANKVRALTNHPSAANLPALGAGCFSKSDRQRVR